MNKINSYIEKQYNGKSIGIFLEEKEYLGYLDLSIREAN